MLVFAPFNEDAFAPINEESGADLDQGTAAHMGELELMKRSTDAACLAGDMDHCLQMIDRLYSFYDERDLVNNT